MAMAQAIRADELEDRISEMLRVQSETTGRVKTMANRWRGARPRWRARSTSGSMP